MDKLLQLINVGTWRGCPGQDKNLGNQYSKNIRVTFIIIYLLKKVLSGYWYIFGMNCASIRYMDRHRDPKQISKEILLERLKKLHPFGPEPPPLAFPSAQPIHPDLTSWERRDVKRRRIGLGKYQDLFRGSNRPA